MASNRHNARKAAVQALYQWDLTQQDAADIESHFAQIHDLQNVDKKYLRLLMTEVPKHHVELEASMKTYIDREFASIDPVERAILRLGAYELHHKPDVPTKVVLNESVELAKIFGSEQSYKFVNGVLDKLAVAVRGAKTKTPR